MHAILLAAGLGSRLAPATGGHRPKCLLEFGGHSLLARHLRLLEAAGVASLTIVTGHAGEAIERAVGELDSAVVVDCLHNARFDLGSVLSVHCARQSLQQATGDVLVMDADVLYDQRILGPLCSSGRRGANVDRVAFDTAFTPGEEPVKLCLSEGRIVEFCKRVAPGLRYDTIGETVGFFRLAPNTARRFAAIVADYVATERADQPHEEALRDLFLERPDAFDVLDIAPAPWLEIDFPEDLARAREDVLPQLQTLEP